MDEQTTRFFLVIKFGGDVPIRKRIIDSVPKIKEIVQRISRGEYQLAFTSDDGGCFGFLLSTKLKAYQIRGHLESPDALQNSIGSPLIREDNLIAVEVGEDFTGYGFSRAWTWLQRHK